MNQALLWTVIAILALIIVGMAAWNLRSEPVEFASPEPTEDTFPTLAPTPIVLASPTPAPVSLVVGPQEPGRTATIASANLATNGFIAIHADANGAPGTVIGVSALLTVGPQANVSVPLNRASRKGEVLHAMLHVDADGDGKYTFPGPDVPATDATGATVTVPFTVGVTASPTPSATPVSGVPGLTLGTPVASPASSPAYSGY